MFLKGKYDMKELNGYLDELVVISRDFIKRNKFDIIKLSTFQEVNFFILDRAINKHRNLFIQLPQNVDVDAFIIPTILSITSSYFLINYIENENDIMNYRVGSVLQNIKTKRRYKIVKRDENNLYFRHKNSDMSVPHMIALRDYKVLDDNAKITKRKSKIDFTNYQNLYDTFFSIVDTPAQFNHKVAVLFNKKHFNEKLSKM
ncbi:MAG: hypothetical protein AB7E96_12010 [Deferribacterales bacterium]